MSNRGMRSARLGLTGLFLLAASCGTPAVRPAPTPAARTEGPPPAPVGLTEALPGIDHPTAPISLTATDGTPLRITALKSTATIDDPLASTEMHLSVENGSAASTEPRLLMSLPRSSRVRRVAIRQGQHWTEESPAERKKLSVSYQEYLAGAVDPAATGAPESGAVDAVFPVLAPGEQAEIVISYDQLLDGGPYQERLRGLAPLDVLSARVDIAGETTSAATADLAGAAPEGDLVVPAARYLRGSVDERAVQSGDVIAIRARIPDGLADQDPLVSPIFLIDTSASAAGNVGSSAALVRDTLAQLPADLPVTVATFDDTVDPAFEGRAGDFDNEAMGHILGKRGLGISNLEKALRWAADQANAAHTDRRLVLLGTGHADAGVTAVANIQSAVKALGEAGIVRADVIAPRRARDLERLDLIVHAGSGRGIVMDADLAPDVLLRRLQRRSRGGTSIAVSGAASLSTTSDASARPGDTIAFVAQGTHASNDVTVTIGGSKHLIPIVRAGGDLSHALEAFLKPVSDGPADLLAPGGSVASISRPALVRDAALAGRFELNGAPPVLDSDAASVDPMNGAVASVVAHQPEPTAPATAEAPAPETPAVDAGPEDVKGTIPPEIVRRIIRINFGRFKACYIDGMRRHPKLAGRITTRFHIEADGTVHDAAVAEDASEIHDATMSDCMAEAFKKVSFPASSGTVAVSYPIVFSTDNPSAAGRGGADHLEAGRSTPKAPPIHQEDDHFDEPLSGRLAAIRESLKSGKAKEALHDAWAWTSETPGDPLSWVALGDAARESGDTMLAERAYASIIDLWNGRADMVRFGAERLELVPTTAALELARDAYEHAIELRPEEPTSYRLAAFAELRLGHTQTAFKKIEHVMGQKFGHDEFVGARETLGEDLALIGAVWQKEEPDRKADIEARMKGVMGQVESEPSLRVVVVWETESTKVSLRVRDATARPDLDQMKSSHTTLKGEYGPDELAVHGARHYPYSLSVDFAKASGPMGFAMGKLEILDHDGRGGLTFEERPFVVTNGVGKVDLGTINLARGGSGVAR